MSELKGVFDVEQIAKSFETDYVFSEGDYDDNGALTPQAKEKLDRYILNHVFFDLEKVEE